MKKFLAVFLALAMVFALNSMAMAVSPIKAVVDNPATDDVVENADTGNVSVTVGDSTPLTVYHVLIGWGTLTFEYTASNPVWDTKKHEYTWENGTWKKDGEGNTLTASVKVENHSNAAVQFTAEFADADNTDGVAVDLSTPGRELASANAAVYRDAANRSEINETYLAGDMETVVVTPTGTPTTNGTIVAGTVTITIEAAD